MRDIFGNYITIGAEPECRNTREKRLVRTDQPTSGAQPLEHLKLCIAYTLSRAEHTYMRCSDVCYNSGILLCAAAHPRYLSCGAHSHLKNESLAIGRNREHGQRHSDKIVKVALRLFGAVFLSEHGVNKLLGCGLSHTAGHGNRMTQLLQLALIGVRNIEKRLSAVPGDYIHALRSILRQSRTDHRRRSALKCRGNEPMPVKALSRESKIYLPGFKRTRIGADAATFCCFGSAELSASGSAATPGDRVKLTAGCSYYPFDGKPAGTYLYTHIVIPRIC